MDMIRVLTLVLMLSPKVLFLAQRLNSNTRKFL